MLAKKKHEKISSKTVSDFILLLLFIRLGFYTIQKIKMIIEFIHRLYLIINSIFNYVRLYWDGLEWKIKELIFVVIYKLYFIRKLYIVIEKTFLLNNFTCTENNVYFYYWNFILYLIFIIII